MTKILMMSLTPQLRKIAVKQRASRPSSLRELDIHFRKLIDKQEQAEFLMKLEVTENLKLQYTNNVQITTLQINNKQESNKLSKKHSNFKHL